MAAQLVVTLGPDQGRCFPLEPGIPLQVGRSLTTATRLTDATVSRLHCEISYDGVIRHNQVSGNGRQHKGWAWDAGIQIQSSGGIKSLEVAHNVVSDNANGITLIDSGDRTDERPAPHGPHLVQNVWVHNNDVSMSAGETTGAVQDTDDPAIFTQNRNRFEANTYHLSSLTQPNFSWADEDLSWTEWRVLANGNDMNGQGEIRRR